MDKKLYKSIISLIVITGLIVWAIMNEGMIFSALGTILKLVSPFFYGCMIAFVLNVLMRPIEKKLAFKLSEGKHTRKLIRPLSIVICVLFLLGLFTAIVCLVVPGVIESVSNFVASVPRYAETVNEWWTGIGAFTAKHGFVLPDLSLDTNDAVNFITGYLSKSGSSLLTATISKTAGLISGFVTALLAMIFAIYIVATKESLGQACKNTIHALCDDKRAERILSFANTTDETFTNFVTGQCLEACCFGVLSFIGLTIFGFPYKGLIAVVLGFTTLIPVFGAFIGGAVGFILIALTNPLKGVFFLIFLMVLQQLDNNLIYPRIVGKQVGLPGMLVLLAVTVGGSGFGLIGMLTSVPICAIVHGAYLEYIDNKLEAKEIIEHSSGSENYDVGD